MRMNFSIDKEEQYNSKKRKMCEVPTYLTLEIVCSSISEMDIIRELFETELLNFSEEFEGSCEKKFASCYCGEEDIPNWDTLSIPYDRYTVKNDRKIFNEIWSKVRKEYKLFKL